MLFFVIHSKRHQHWHEPFSGVWENQFIWQRDRTRDKTKKSEDKPEDWANELTAGCCPQNSLNRPIGKCKVCICSVCALHTCVRLCWILSLVSIPCLTMWLQSVCVIHIFMDTNSPLSGSILYLFIQKWFNFLLSDMLSHLLYFWPGLCLSYIIEFKVAKLVKGIVKHLNVLTCWHSYGDEHFISSVWRKYYSSHLYPVQAFDK